MKGFKTQALHRHCAGIDKAQHLLTQRSIPLNKLFCVQELFVELDTDSSGAVSLDELSTGLRKQGYNLSDNEIEQLVGWEARCRATVSNVLHLAMMPRIDALRAHVAIGCGHLPLRLPRRIKCCAHHPSSQVARYPCSLLPPPLPTSIPCN